MRESEIQRQGVALLRKLGGRVWVTSQRRASSVTKGVPDVMAFFPGKRLFFFWEAKASKGILSDDQLKFATTCWESGVEYVQGDLTALEDHLRFCEVLAA